MFRLLLMLQTCCLAQFKKRPASKLIAENRFNLYNVSCNVM